MRIIHERQFSEELGRVEPDPRHQSRALEVIEEACKHRVKRCGAGYSFARLFWKRKLLVWYLGCDCEITLLSIRPDLT